MPTALRALQAATDLAERERDRALDALRRAEAAADDARRQDEMLAQYGVDLDRRWGARTGLAGSPAQLEHAHAFGRRIDQAREQQRGQCTLLGDRVAHARAHWRACEQRLMAVRRLVERRLQALAADESRRAQRQTDEAALRIVRTARETRAADNVM